MPTLLIGFDSAWTPTNSGSLVGIVRREDERYTELGPPRIVDFKEAETLILRWQSELTPARTLILLDQPTIVGNVEGQRPVENIVGSAVSLRYGGMQPANTSRSEMFGTKAPIWPFLERFGGPADLLNPLGDTSVIETYPVLALIALRWLLPDSRATGRLPKYNPGRKSTFSISDWRHVCRLAAEAFSLSRIPQTAEWLSKVADKDLPRKSDQDGVDACLCLLVAVWMAEGNENLVVGDMDTGYIVAPHDGRLAQELRTRCLRTERPPSEWLRIFRLEQSSGSFRLDSIDESGQGEVQKPYHGMTPAERTAARIAKNREIERSSLKRQGRYTLDEIASRLNDRRQRATYGAVAKLVGVLPRGLMNDRAKSPEFSWIVAASGSERGRPTGYNVHQVHPECLRQIHDGQQNLIDNAEVLERWLAGENSSA